VAETKDRKGKPDDKGKGGHAGLIISPAIVTDIVKREALNTAGVVEVVGASFIGRGKGIIVTEVPKDGDTAYKIEMHLFVEYGTNCRKLCEMLAERVSKTVKQMTQREVLDVISHIDGIRDSVHGEGTDDNDPSSLDF